MSELESSTEIELIGYNHGCTEKVAGGLVTICISPDGRHATIRGSPDVLAQASARSPQKTCTNNNNHEYETSAQTSSSGNQVQIAPHHKSSNVPVDGYRSSALVVKGHDPEANRRWKSWATKTLMN
jgi:hypothetical protein